MRNYRPFFCSSAQFLPYRSQPMLQNSKELPKKLFKFLKKVIIILEAVISLFFMFKTARFLLSLGYVARYAPSKNNKTFHF